MKAIKVNLRKRSYSIVIGDNLLEKLPHLVKKGVSPHSPLFVITNSRIFSIYGKRLTKSLRKISPKIYVNKVPDSERAKSFKVYNSLLSGISGIGKGVKPVVIAFGGGVIGDVAGFVAATYRRGIPYIQIPTTLLAQVDSAIGGKVAIDMPQAKNIVGSFYQPKLVVCDISLLKTLPKAEIKSGLAEALKYGVIKDASLFNYLSKNLKKILRLNPGPLKNIVWRSAKIKASVVEKDEFDTKGLRAILNFGHTLGHAIEAAAKYKKIYTHGTAVALGMILASEISEKLGMADEAVVSKIKSLIRRVGFPAKIKGVRISDILRALAYDKKFVRGVTRFVLLRRVGKVEVVEGVPLTLVKEVLKDYS